MATLSRDVSRRLGTLILEAEANEIQLTKDGDELVVRGPVNAMEDELREALTAHKAALIQQLGQDRADGRTWLKPALYEASFWAPRRCWHQRFAYQWRSARNDGER
jgi:hypothetical protein